MAEEDWSDFPIADQQQVGRTATLTANSNYDDNDWSEFPAAKQTTPSPRNLSGGEAGALAAIGANTDSRSPYQQLREAVTGEGKTQYPDAPEFLPAYVEATHGRLDDGFTAINQSAVTPDQNAQLDILKKRIPGLETQLDAHGNLMLRAPGMKDWAYLNKPGVSGRDIDELGTQTLATLPFMGMWGRGASTLARAGTAAGAGAGSSITQDVLASAAGSDQGIDPMRAGVSAGIGAVTAPGVPSLVAQTVERGARGAVNAGRNAAERVFNPERAAERTVADAFVRDATGNIAPNMTGQQAEALGRTRLAAAAPEQDARLMDIGGERVRDLARSAANISPEARQVLTDVIQPRFETQNQRAITAIRDIAGTAGNATHVQRGIEDASRVVNRQAYDRAYQMGANGISSPVITRILQAPAAREAVEAAADGFANKQAAGRVTTGMRSQNGEFTLEFLDQVARTLSDREGALRIAGNRDAAATIGELRRQLQDQLDLAVPAFQAARGYAATFFQASDALDAGRRVALGKFTAADARDRVGERITTGNWTSAQIAQAIGRMSPTERALFREGYVSGWVEKLSATGDNRNVVSLLNGSPKVREELATVLGANRARQLEAYLHVERTLDRIRTAVGGNSTTARQLVQLGLATGAGASINGLDPTNPAGWIAAILTYRGSAYARNAIDQRAAMAVARLLTSNDPAVFARGIRAAANPRILEAFRRADEAFTGPARAVLSRGLTPDASGVDATQPSP